MRADRREAGELGPLLARAASALHRLLEPEQVYVTLWSHAGGVPRHIHWVIQPVGAGRADGLVGPHLQAEMFDRGELPARSHVETLSAQLRVSLAGEDR